MRLGVNVKYSHTKEEMTQIVLSIDAFAHIYDVIDSSLESYYIPTKKYWQTPWNEYIDASSGTYISDDTLMSKGWIKVNLYNCSEALKVLVYDNGVICRNCGNNFDKLCRENYAQKQWHQIYNRTRTFRDFATEERSPNCYFYQWNYCQACIELLEDAISLLIDKEIIEEYELKAFTGKQLIELQMQNKEIIELELLIRTIQKEIRMQQKNERNRIQPSQKENENDAAATCDSSRNNG